MTKLTFRILSFSQRLFISVILLFIAFAVCFMIFQYQREKSFKTELLNTQLQNYNIQLYDYLTDSGRLDMDSLQKYVERHLIPNLRVTIIQPDGKVIYDNSSDKWEQFPNHASRKEIQNALMQGSGYAISRRSESIQGEEYFYSAHYFPSHRLIIRSAFLTTSV